jgi:ATP-dependent Lon protease
MDEHDEQKNQAPKKRYNLRKRKPSQHTHNENNALQIKSQKKSSQKKVIKSKRKPKKDIVENDIMNEDEDNRQDEDNEHDDNEQVEDDENNEEDDNDEDDDSIDNHSNVKELIDYDCSDDEDEAEEVEDALEQIVSALSGGKSNIRNIEIIVKDEDDEDDDDEEYYIPKKRGKMSGKHSLLQKLFVGIGEDDDEDDEDNEEDDSEYIPDEDDEDDDDQEFENNVDENMSEDENNNSDAEDEEDVEDEEDEEDEKVEDEDKTKNVKNKRNTGKKKNNAKDKKKYIKPTLVKKNQNIKHKPSRQSNRQSTRQSTQRSIQQKKKSENREKDIKNIKNKFIIRQMFELKNSEITPEILEYYDTIDNKINNVPFMDEMRQFIEYTPKKQRKIIKQVKTLEKKTKRKPFKFQLLDLKVSPELKAVIYEKVAMFSTMEATSGDYYKLQSWIHSFFKLPFNRKITLPIKMSDQQSKIQSFLKNAKEKMDLELYGQNNAKDQFLQILCQWISNPNSGTNVIGLHGPPGVGKTSFIKNAVSYILKRPFGFVSLGGATDSSLLDGFSYTYEGSNYGKIVEILIKTNCMNPVIYFDELDKISSTNKGDELWNVLTHITDATQNSHFNDKYFAGVDLDLSKALFIFSFNDIEKINKILLDRLYVIYMDGYSVKEKTEITLNYLLPKTLKKYNLEGMVRFDNNKDIGYLIEAYMKKDVKGVRDLQRLLDTMISRINVQRLMGDKLEAEYKLDTLEFPLLINKDIIDKLLKDKKPEKPPYMNYIV